jgi:hypothetical protein
MLRIPHRIPVDYAIELWLWTKVKKEPELEIGCSEIVVQLSSGGFVKVRCRFSLHDEFFVYNEVKPLGPKLLSFVKNVDSYFP